MLFRCLTVDFIHHLCIHPHFHLVARRDELIFFDGAVLIGVDLLEDDANLLESLEDLLLVAS